MKLSKQQALFLLLCTDIGNRYDIMVLCGCGEDDELALHCSACGWQGTEDEIDYDKTYAVCPECGEGDIEDMSQPHYKGFDRNDLLESDPDDWDEMIDDPQIWNAQVAQDANLYLIHANLTERKNRKEQQ